MRCSSLTNVSKMEKEKANIEWCKGATVAIYNTSVEWSEVWCCCTTETSSLLSSKSERVKAGI